MRIYSLACLLSFILTLAANAEVKPFLYSVTKPGQEVSFLMGTRHSPIPAQEFPEYFWRAFDSRKYVAKENVTDENDKDSAPITLPPEIPEPSERAKEQLRQRGLPEYLHRSGLVCNFYFNWEPIEIPYVDALLELRARANKRRLIGLDVPAPKRAANEPAEPLAPCDIESLTEFIPGERLKNTLQEALETYKRGEDRDVHICPPGDECEKRTISWVPKLERLFARKGTFVAVGVGHLGGPNGLITLLEKRGYTIERVTSMEQVNFLTKNSSRR